MILTLSQLEKILQGNKSYGKWLDALNNILPKYEINTLPRITMFLAQTCHESNRYTVLRENLNYSSDGLLKIFPKYFNKALADLYQRQPQKIANRVYANRMGNGPETSGDGYKFRGIGILQYTGKENIQKFAEYTNKSIDEVLDYMLTPEGSVEAACLFWKTRALNLLSDKEDIVSVTKKINGGTIGLEHRKEEYLRIKNILE